METRVLPVFLDVDPSDVRHQRGSFAEAFDKHEEKFSDNLEKVERWRAALTKVANLSGFHSENYESEGVLIIAIVKDVWDKVRPTITLLHSTDKLVGIDFGLMELGRLLDLEAKDVRFLGIWGMGGVGKTTLAHLFFKRISHQFEVCEFLVDVREVYAKHGTLVDLQKQFLSPILKENIAQVWDKQRGIFFIKKCMFNKKVLLVVDDVDCSAQLKWLVGNKSWFGEGSRIIVTTRDERLLIENDIEISFKVIGLDKSDALELFSHNAFKKDRPEEGFLELSKCFVDYTEGLPLALKILGGSLYKRDLDAWNSELDKLKQIPNATILQKLKLSYDPLDVIQKEILLDVAFFHKGMEKGRVIELLDRSGFCGRIGIDVLIEKCLLTIEACNNVGMHGLVQEMAWDIVYQESRAEPGLRSRLCHRDDIFHAFMKNTGTEAIKGICLCLPSLEEADSNWNCGVFSKMPHLRFLKFDNLIISSGPKFLPDSLRILEWNWYPSKFLPASFRPNLLGELKMQNSKVVRLWDGKLDLPNLKTMCLSHSKNLIKTPDFTGIPNLEKLDLSNCTGLVEIHQSIASNKKLKLLILRGCGSIKIFPRKIEMDSLQLLNLWGCTKVKIPEFGEGMVNLSYIHLCKTASEVLPSSIEHLVGLTILYLYDSKSLKCIPGTAIFKLTSLRDLRMNGCSKLETLVENTGETESSIGRKIRKLHEGLLDLIGRKRKSPEPLGLALQSPRVLRSLQTLNLADCNLCDRAIPDDIGYCFPSLEYLELGGNNFVSLPASIKCLSKLRFIDLRRCKRLQQLPDLPSNGELEVWADDCTSLKMLSEPSQQGRSTNLVFFNFTSVNCSRLGVEEDLNNGIFSLLRRLAAQGISPHFHSSPIFNIVSSGSKISEWFNIRSEGEGDSLTVELPPPDRKSEWTGIMFFVVFTDQKNNPTVLEYPSYPSKITCFWEGIDKQISVFRLSLCRVKRDLSHAKGDHVWVFFMSHSKIQETTECSISFSFATCYLGLCRMSSPCSCLNGVKKCGARILYDQDLKQLLDGRMNIFKRSREFCD